MKLKGMLLGLREACLNPLAWAIYAICLVRDVSSGPGIGLYFLVPAVMLCIWLFSAVLYSRLD